MGYGWRGKPVGRSLALEAHGASAFKSGVRLSGVLSTDQRLTDGQRADLKKAWDAAYGGAENTGKAAVLGFGMKWTPLSIPNDAAQYVESRQYQVEEVCRAFGVLPITAGRSDKASTYASAEQMFLQHAVHTLGPWYACLEKSASRWLLSDEERRDGYYFKFNVNGLMRGAAKRPGPSSTPGSTAWRALSPNDIRELEDMNPYEGGDEYRVPLNMAEPGTDGDDAEKGEGDEDVEERLDCGLVELRAAPDAGPEAMTFSGYGAVFGNVDAYGDVIAKGAFDRSIADFKASGAWPAMLSQHGGWDMSAESLTPIGVWTEMREDGHGLYVEGRLADTPRGREMYALDEDDAAPGHQRPVHRLPGRGVDEAEQAG